MNPGRVTVEYITDARSAQRKMAKRIWVGTEQLELFNPSGRTHPQESSRAVEDISFGTLVARRRDAIQLMSKPFAYSFLASSHAL